MQYLIWFIFNLSGAKMRGMYFDNHNEVSKKLFYTESIKQSTPKEVWVHFITWHCFVDLKEKNLKNSVLNRTES